MDSFQHTSAKVRLRASGQQWQKPHLDEASTGSVRGSGLASGKWTCALESLANASLLHGIVGLHDPPERAYTGLAQA